MATARTGGSTRIAAPVLAVSRGRAEPTSSQVRTCPVSASSASHTQARASSEARSIPLHRAPSKPAASAAVAVETHTGVTVCPRPPPSRDRKR